ncbi:aldehyde dehydrogenase [Bradyrhizobium sp. USDA 4474]
MNKPEFLTASQNPFTERYDNFIGGKWVAPRSGKYFDNASPVTGQVVCKIARSEAPDIEAALDAAHAAKEAWGRTSVVERALILNRIADRMEENLELLAIAETWDNGKPIRETRAADLPLAIDHFRYFAGVVRGQEGSLAEIDNDTVAYHFHEPLGVVGQIIPWNFPLLMACWKMAPALAAGNCVVLKPAEQTPASIMVWIELIGDLLPPGVLNIVNGFGLEAGKPLASSPRISKIAFTGETSTGRLIMQYASQNLIRVTLELGGKSPNIFFKDVAAENDDFLDKAIEGFVMFALNQGEVCTCPSRALVQESIYERFMEKALKRVRAITQGDPRNAGTMIGAQASGEQLEKILSYIDIGKKEGAQLLTGGARADLGGDLSGGFYVQPTVFHGNNKMADLPGGDFRPRGLRHHLQDRRGGARDRQRHAIRPRRRRLEPRRQSLLSLRPSDPGRPGLDQLLSCLSRPCRLRRLQAVGYRSRDPQDDARPLSADQESAGQLQPEEARLLLKAVSRADPTVRAHADGRLFQTLLCVYFCWK